MRRLGRTLVAPIIVPHHTLLVPGYCATMSMTLMSNTVPSPCQRMEEPWSGLRAYI